MESSRRTFLKTATLAGAATTAGVILEGATMNQPQRMSNHGGGSYVYRIGFGAWINDMRYRPLPLQDWPAPQFDDATVEGAVKALEVMADARYGYLDAFGLWATGDYPPDIVSAFQDKSRNARLRRLFREAEKRGIGMVLPLGLLTWGFDRIIAEDPETRGQDQEGKPHAHAMCGAKEKSWKHIEKLIDTAMAQWDFKGVHMESADQGWCMCPECGGRYGAVGYNARVNIRAADYIKRKWPKVVVYTIPINWVPWRLAEDGAQQRFTKEEFEYVLELSKHIDIFMDQGHRGCFVPPEWISKLHCAYGTSGGLWLYHSVRMPRLTYLIPYPKRACELIRRDYERGARACLYYQGPMINPGVELNSAVAGRIMQDVTRDPRAVVDDAIETYYRPRTPQARRILSDVFLRVEEGFFGRWDPATIKKAHNLDMPGEFMGWGLFGAEPDLPGHLYEPFLNKEGRVAYKEELMGCLRDLDGIRNDMGDTERFARLTDALAITIQFLKSYIAFKT